VRGVSKAGRHTGLIQCNKRNRYVPTDRSPHASPFAHPSSKKYEFTPAATQPDAKQRNRREVVGRQGIIRRVREYYGVLGVER
jgi:hypothetical protein